MKAVRFHHTGGPDVLVFEDVADPTPGPGEVLIKIEAVGLNFADVMRRRGDDYPDPSPPPFILGAEVAGVIEGVGAGVELPLGTAVVATPGAGGYAQYICVPAATVIPLPEGLPAVQAASLLGHALTAAIALKHSARLAAGETVLVEAAAGGVGSFAVQLAKLYGAGKVIAAASTAEKRAKAESLGADASVDYTQPGWEDKVRELTGGKGVDVVLETAGGAIFGQALSAMAPFGRMVFIGQSSGEPSVVEAWKLTVPNQSVTGFYIGGFLTVPNLFTDMMGEIMGFLMAGKLTINVGTVLPLSEAAEAHRLLEGRSTMGKVILQPWA